MAIKLKKIQRKNPQDLTQSKWYLTQEKVGSVNLQEIAKEIGERSSLSFGDVQSVLSNMVEILPLFLKLGQTIKLDGFGSFHVSVKSEGTETNEELTTHDVKGTKLVFLPSIALKRNLGDISYEMV
jgi:predicted histone-like DNA-binding protein